MLHNIRRQWLFNIKHSNLLVRFVSYEENKELWIPAQVLKTSYDKLNIKICVGSLVSLKGAENVKLLSRWGTHSLRMDAKTLSITTFSITTFSIMTFSIMTLSIKDVFEGFEGLSINDIQHCHTQHNRTSWMSLGWMSRFIYCYAECYYAEFHYAECCGA